MKKVILFVFLFYSGNSYSNFYYNSTVEAETKCYQHLAANSWYTAPRPVVCGPAVGWIDNSCTSDQIGFVSYWEAIDGNGSRIASYFVSCNHCPEGTTFNEVTAHCDNPKDCFGAYNDVTPLLPGIQCVLQKANGTPNPATCNGNPCDASTGNKFQTEVDYSSTSLNFIRYYNSLHSTESVLGKQWTHHYLASLTIGTTIEVNRPDGKILEFTDNAGNWVSDADMFETLTSVGSDWEFKTTNDSLEHYNSAGQLLSITTRAGKVTHYAYNLNGLLETVTDPYDRTLGFAYDTANRLITLSTPENTQIHYTYDANNNLISVTYPDDTPIDLTDNPKKTYHYEDINFPNHLTGITDENGIRYATYGYNENGLAILTEHANSAEKVELVYNNNETTTVTDALGRVKTYTFEAHYGLRKPALIEYTYNDGKQLVTKNKTYTYYPENGRVKDITDFEGNITYFEYNSRGLVTLETQAKGKPESFTVTTTWHPNFRLPVTRTYPDRTETYSYDSNGQLINTQISSNL